MSSPFDTTFIQETFLVNRRPTQTSIASRGLRRLASLRKRASVPSLGSAFRQSVDALGNTFHGLREGLYEEGNEKWQQKEQTRQILHARMREATSCKEYQECAIELDRLEGHDVWKRTFECDDYDPVKLNNEIHELEDARISCDVYLMLILIRTRLSRNLAGMNNVRLYKHSHIGTKELVDTYINTAVNTIESLVNVVGQCDAGLAEEEWILEQLKLARQSFGRSALLLSGGATLGMKHIGVVKALWEAKLLPRVISGVSAGSIVASVLCKYTDEELPRVLTKFPFGDLNVFDELDKETIKERRLSYIIRNGALFDPAHLQRVMKGILGDITFLEAYNRTRRILNVGVSNRGPFELAGLLNYVTAPNVVIWSAVTASCAVPFVFRPSNLLAKTANGELVDWSLSDPQWIDGSVDNDLPLVRLSEMFNINHFIVSQVNPHVAPFLAKEPVFDPSDPLQPQATSSGWAAGLTSLARDELVHRLQVFVELGIFPNEISKCISILSQQYSGDINIFPEISPNDLPLMLCNPTSKFMLDAQLCGERATWPKLSRIHNHVAIELALDQAVYNMMARVAFHESLAALRLKTWQKTERARAASSRKRRSSQSNEHDSVSSLKHRVSGSRLRRALSTSAANGLVPDLSLSIPGTPHPRSQPITPPESQSRIVLPELGKTTSWPEPKSPETVEVHSTSTLSPSASFRSLVMTPAMYPRSRRGSRPQQLLNGDIQSQTSLDATGTFDETLATGWR